MNIAICGNSIAAHSKQHTTDDDNIEWMTVAGSRLISHQRHKRIENQIYKTRAQGIVLVEPASIEILDFTKTKNGRKSFEELKQEMIEEMGKISKTAVKHRKIIVIIRCELKDGIRGEMNAKLNDFYDKLKSEGFDNIHVDPNILSRQYVYDDIHLNKIGEQMLMVKIQEYVDNFRKADKKTRYMQ